MRTESPPAQLCLELVIAVALRNRDRLLLVWPLVHEYLAAVLSPEGPRGASALVARAALGLLRVCQRLLPYKEDTADALLRSLGLVLRLRPSAAWELAQRLATEVRYISTYLTRHDETGLLSREVSCCRMSHESYRVSDSCTELAVRLRQGCLRCLATCIASINALSAEQIL